MHIIAGAIPDDGGYYIERRVDPHAANDLDQYHEFGNSNADHMLFQEFLADLVKAGDKVALLPVQYRS